MSRGHCLQIKNVKQLPDQPTNLHTYANDQVAAGMAGMILEKANTLEERALERYRTRQMVFQSFQVVAINGVPVKGVDYRDTVQIPPMANGVPVRVVRERSGRSPRPPGGGGGRAPSSVVPTWGCPDPRTAARESPSRSRPLPSCRRGRWCP